MFEKYLNNHCSNTLLSSMARNFFIIPIFLISFFLNLPTLPISFENKEINVFSNLLTILNPHEHPKGLEQWTVYFKTEGTEKLVIAPYTKETAHDLSFITIYCGDKEVQPVMHGDALIIEKWFCNDTASITHLVNIAGDHTLSFQFGNIQEFAFNSAVWQWAKRLGWTGLNDQAYYIATDSENGAILTGRIEGVVDLNGDGDNTDGGAELATGYGSHDIFVAKFNSAGVLQWAKRLGGLGSDMGYGVCADTNDDIIVTGRVIGTADLTGDADILDGSFESSSYGSNDIFITKFDADGNWQWAKRLGGANDDGGWSITCDNLNDVIITGRINGNGDVNGDGDQSDGGAESAAGYGNYDILISKFDSSGSWQWAKRLGGTSVEFGYSLATDLNNNIVFAGAVTGAADVNGDGDSLDGGAELATGYGGTDAIISIFNSSGVWQWAKRLGGTSNDYAQYVAVDNLNQILVSSRMIGNADVNGDGDSLDGGAESATGYGLDDIVVIKFNSSGLWQWAERLGGVTADYGQTIASDSFNNIILGSAVSGNADVNGDGDSSDGGAESGTGYGAIDYLLTIFDSSGNWQWAKRLGGVGSDAVYGISVDNQNSIYLSGYMNGDVDINGDGDNTDGGAESVTNYGGSDVLFTKFANDTEAPIISLNAVAPDPTSDNTPTIVGTISDDFGVVTSLEYQLDGVSGLWTACTINGIDFDCEITTPINDGLHTIYLRATDSNGNTTPSGSETIDIFMIDTTAPTNGLISINSGAIYTLSNNVILTLSVSGGSSMILSENNTFSDVNWESYSVSKSFVLSAEDGEKIIYAKFRDAANNESEIYSDTIILDTDIPISEGEIVAEEAVMYENILYVNDSTITLDLEVADELSGVISMMISDDPNFSDATWEDFETTKAWDLGEDNGIKTVYVKYKDEAGNESEIYSLNLILDTETEVSLYQIEDKEFNEDLTSWETTSTKPLLSGMGEVDAIIQIIIHSDQEIVASTTVDSDGNWTYTPSEELTIGEHTIAITATDIAGNTDTFSFNLNVLGQDIIDDDTDTGTDIDIDTDTEIDEPTDTNELPNTGINHSLIIFLLIAVLWSAFNFRIIEKLRKYIK